MSLSGRRIIDRVKQAVKGVVSLPVPPYESAGYWEGVYKTSNPNDVYEWGNTSFADLQKYTYRNIAYEPWGIRCGSNDDKPGEFSKTLLLQEQSQYPILVLGCGSSRLGEDMVQAGLQPVVQIDVSARCIEMKNRQPAARGLTYLQDDATQLSALEGPNCVRAVVDKGLVDALFCANAVDQCRQVLESVQNVLLPQARCAVFSFSQPEYLLPHLHTPGWADIEIQEVNGQILLYLFRKTDDKQSKAPTKSARKMVHNKRYSRR